MKKISLFALVVGLAACGSDETVETAAMTANTVGSETAVTPIPTEPQKTAEELRAEAEALVAECKAQPLLDLIGQPQTELTGLLPEGSRVIEANGIITQDYRPERVNVDLDEMGNIARVWCG